MDRNELNAEERRGLSKMVGKLFDGAVIAMPDSKAGVKYLCFRMEGEEMPELPLGRPSESRATGLFVSAESFVGGRLDSRIWLGTGHLDEILITLEAFGGDVRQMLSRFLHESAVRAALGTKDDKPYDLSLSPSTIPFAPRDDLGQQADAEFEAYDFGDDCRVVGHDGWERVESGDEAEFTKIVYVRFADDGVGVDSHRVGFTVLFQGDQVEQVSATLTRSGDDIGQRAVDLKAKRSDVMAGDIRGPFKGSPGSPLKYQFMVMGPRDGWVPFQGKTISEASKKASDYQKEVREQVRQAAEIRGERPSG